MQWVHQPALASFLVLAGWRGCPLNRGRPRAAVCAGHLNASDHLARRLMWDDEADRLRYERAVQKLPIAIATVVMFATPSQAFYTGCTVREDTMMVTRPDGNITPPRWHTLEKGDKVAILEWYPQPDSHPE